jgi:hypothetical protein
MTDIVFGVISIGAFLACAIGGKRDSYRVYNQMLEDGDFE